MTEFAFGPWPAGQDTFHAPSHAVFQLSDGRRERLAVAVNVNIDDEGWALRRAGLIQRLSLSNGLGTFAFGSFLFVQDGGTILSIDQTAWTSTSLVTGLTASARVLFYEHAGQVWWTNGEACGRIDASGTAHGWGYNKPGHCVLSALSGPLAAGTYQVACTAQYADGAESGTGRASEIALPEGSAISVALPDVPDGAESINIYVTNSNLHGLMWQKNVLASKMPTAIIAVRDTKRPLRTQFRGPPPAGTGIFSYRGLLLIYRDGALFRSSGISHHLFLATQSETLPSAILAGAGLSGGFWRVTAHGAWWTVGQNPVDWHTEHTDTIEYAAGSMMISGLLIPKLEETRQIALFFSTRGLMVGLPDGRMINLATDQLRIDVHNKRASFILKDKDSLRSLIVILS